MFICLWNSFNPSYINTQSGIVNQGLEFMDGARMNLIGSINDCLVELAACGNMQTITMWIKPSATDGFSHGTHGKYHINIVISGGHITTWIHKDPYKFSSITSVSNAPVGGRTHVGVSYSRDTEVHYT